MTSNYTHKRFNNDFKMHTSSQQGVNRKFPWDSSQGNSFKNEFFWNFQNLISSSVNLKSTWGLVMSMNEPKYIKFKAYLKTSTPSQDQLETETLEAWDSRGFERLRSKANSNQVFSLIVFPALLRENFSLNLVSRFANLSYVLSFQRFKYFFCNLVNRFLYNVEMDKI